MTMITIGLIGCGGWASRMHIPALTQLISEEKINVGAVCDIDSDKAEKTATALNANTYTDVDSMLQREQLDAVSILLPPHVTETLIEKAIKHDLAFLTEKPPVSSAAKQKQFINDVGEHPHVVAYNRRFAPYTEIARNFMADQTLQAVNVAFARHRRFDEQFSSTYVHGLDYLLSTVGPVREIQANISHADNVCNIALHVRGINNVLGQLIITPNAGTALEHYQIRSAERVVDVAFPQFGMYDLPGSVSCYERNELIERHDAQSLGIDPENMSQLGGIVNEYLHLSSVIENKTPSISTLASTLQTQEIREWLDQQDPGLCACELDIL